MQLYPYLSRLIPTYTREGYPGISHYIRILSLHIPKQLFYPYLYWDSREKSKFLLSRDIPV